MEQFRFLSIRTFLALSGLVLVVLSGCKSDMRHPEMVDLIYIDLKKTADQLEDDVLSIQKELLSIQKTMNTLEVNTKDLHLARKKAQELKSQLRKAQQMQKYYKIRAARRLIESKQAQVRAAETGEVWPNPEEFKAYKVEKRLKSASSNWNSRVPKLTERLRNYSAEASP